nr:putative ribonuclease H-like domain-containing protein [Tanacetum cinerariifolium]
MPRFARDITNKGTVKDHEKGINFNHGGCVHGGGQNRSYLNVVKGKANESKDPIEKKVVKEGFLELSLKYVGGLWVLIEFQTASARNSFLNHKGMHNWLSKVIPWPRSFVPRERLIWFDIEDSFAKVEKDDNMKENNDLGDLQNEWGSSKDDRVDEKFRIQQYLQHEHYALWKVIEFGNSYKAPPEETAKDKGLAGEVSSSTKKKGRTMAITAEDMQKRKNDVKARTTLLSALPDKHQLRFSKYDSAKELWEAILETFGGNEATKKTKKNQLKKQYGNFKAEGLETLEQTSNRDDLDIMSLDDVYNHLKVYEPEVQKRAGSNLQNMAFVSSSNTNSGKSKVPTIQGASTASAQVSTVSTDVVVASLSYDTVSTRPNGSQIKYEDISQIDDDDIEEMDIKLNLALLSMRADRSPRSQDRGKKESYKKDPKVEQPAPKAMIAIDSIGWDWSYMAEEDKASKNHAFVADEEEYEPFNGGYVSFGHGRRKITGKGSIKTGKLEFENVYFMKELKYNLFSVSQICDNKNSVLFADTECLVLEKDFKIVDDKHVLLRTPRQQNMYTIDMKNIVPHKNLTCLIAKASVDKGMLWHRRLGHLNFKTINKLVRSNLVKGLPSKSFKNDHSCVDCLKGKHHKAS